MPSPRSTVITVPPPIHGARDYTELQRLGLAPDDVIDFSTNSNPYGPHPAIFQAMGEALADPALVRRYPDRDCLALRAAIAVADKVPQENILPGNGATELIHLIALTFVKPDSRHLILSPTFGEYSRALHLMGGKVYECRPETHHLLHLDLETITTTIHRVQPDTIWLCNPNNPTGQYWSKAELAQLRAADPDARILWIIDEAYRHFVDPGARGNDEEQWTWGENVIRLRSLTKDHSLAGLRLGYLLAAPKLVNLLKAAQPPWSVNSLAQMAGVAALQTESITWRNFTLTQLRQHALDLWVGLSQLGLPIHPTSTTFALLKVKHAPEFRHHLLMRGLLVRDCASFGLPGHIRVAAHRPAANERLRATIAELLAQN
ncbi:MAG: histidinol-phosphate aminotransferase family protein [Anaerolineae bacterium]|nr:histidinol-phosphate aminotransferase family protein [Anaerolineae bacterium]